MKNIATISVGFCFPTLLFNFKGHCTIKFLEEVSGFTVKEERMGEKFDKRVLSCNLPLEAFLPFTCLWIFPVLLEIYCLLWDLL